MAPPQRSAIEGDRAVDLVDDRVYFTDGSRLHVIDPESGHDVLWAQ